MEENRLLVVIATLAGLLSFLLLLWWVYQKLLLRSDRSARLHRNTQSDAARIRLKVIDIGKQSGPAAQFGYLRKIDPFAFEELVLTCLSEQGKKVRRNDKYTGDGGIDGYVLLDDKWHLLQMKRYRNHINRRHVEVFSKQCETAGSPGLFIHTGRTGDKAWRSAGDSVQVISGRRLIKFLGLGA